MSDEPKKSDLERTQELLDFLMGVFPDRYKIPKKQRPKLTREQAFTVIWYLGNQYWQVTDHVEKCDVCGALYDAHREGACLDYGRAPYSFCDNCISSEEFHKKNRRNPDKEARKEYT